MDQAMKRRLNGFGIALIMVCVGCGPRQGDGGANVSVPASPNGKEARTEKSAPRAPGEKAPSSGAVQTGNRSAVASKAEIAALLRSGQALRFPDPGEPHWKKWLTYSESEEGEEKFKTYRIPGDAFSKYYDVEANMAEGDQDTGIRNDKGAYLDTSFYRYADYIGIRKTLNDIFIYAYFLPDDDNQIGNYDIAHIKNGKLEMVSCDVSLDTLKKVANVDLRNKKILDDARFRYATDVLDLFTSLEPDFTRETCI
jgi:hypothetical protein